MFFKIHNHMYTKKTPPIKKTPPVNPGHFEKN